MTLLKRLRDRQLLSKAVASLQVPKRESAVYVIKIGSLYKIGVSVRAEERIAGMQLPQRPEVVLIYRVQKAAQLERALHRKYAKERRHGEWFELERPQVGEILKVCDAWRKEVEQ